LPGAYFVIPRADSANLIFFLERGRQVISLQRLEGVGWLKKVQEQGLQEDKKDETHFKAHDVVEQRVSS
jgi:hypothetical protein